MPLRDRRSAGIWDLMPSQIEQGLRTYPGLPHRMERVREKDGVLFVNDSKATNPTATAPALAAFPSDPLDLRRAGEDRQSRRMRAALRPCRARPTPSARRANCSRGCLSPHMPVAECETLEDAVNRGRADATAGDTVLLSPACASFDQFRDFEERGDRFRELVGAL